MNFREFNEAGSSGPYADTSSAGIGRNENTAQAIKTADEAVTTCDEAFVKAMEKVGRKTHYETVVIPIYVAYCGIEESNCGPQFLAERQVKIHRNTKNDCYPFFLAFTKTAHPLLRDRVCKFAEVAALARLEKVVPEKFGEWLKSHPIEKACAEYRRLMREQRNSQRDKATRRIKEILIDPKKEPDKTPLRDATPLTVGLVGVGLAVIECVPDGRGDFRLLGALSYTADEVTRIVEAAPAETTH